MVEGEQAQHVEASESEVVDPLGQTLPPILQTALRWVPIHRVPRRVLISGAIAVVIAVVAIVSLVPIFLDISQDDLETLGYPGVFLANFLGTATVFIPVPGLTAAGQALIIALGQTLNPLGVAFAASAGMTSGEITAYVAGMVGRALSEERQAPMSGRLGRILRRAAGAVNRLMLHYGFLTLLVLSAVPNPVFEFAGITAGAVRMNFLRFLLAVGIGKTIRALLLAYLGNIFPGLPGL